MFPLSLPTSIDLIIADTKFQIIKAFKPPLTPLTRPPFPLWMSLETIKLIEKRTALRRNSCQFQNVASLPTK